MSMNDETAQSFGFADIAEFNRMIAAVDLSTPEKRAAFKSWQDEDGTKTGLVKLGE
jgi:hypothetical protein